MEDGPVSPCRTNSFYFVELFSGSGHLSAAMKRRGFSVFPVDHEFNTHKTAVSTISLNLQDEKSQQLVESMITQIKPAAIHLGLPCGTCSRARDKPLPEHLRAQFHDPPPLRDANNLLGYPHLSGIQAKQLKYKRQMICTNGGSKCFTYVSKTASRCPSKTQSVAGYGESSPYLCDNTRTKPSWNGLKTSTE